MKFKYVVFVLAFFFIPAIAFSLSDWEIDVLRKTRDIKRISVEQAYAIYQTGQSILISVDGKEYFNRIRIQGAYNIPAKKFTPEFIERIKPKLKKFKFILLYCR